MANDEEARRHVLNHLRSIFTQLAQLSVATRAPGVLGKVGPDFAWQMRRKRATLVLSAPRLLHTDLLLLGLNRLLRLDHATTQAKRQLVLVECSLL